MIDEERLQSGALLYERYHAAMMKRAKRYLSEISDAEDAVSSCWIRLLPRIDTLMLMDEQARSSYILATVQNEAIDRFRSQRRELVNTVELGEDIADSGDEYSNLIANEALTSMLAMLPPQEAKIVRFKLDGIGNEEIASRLQLSQSTVRVYWQRGRARLRLLVQALDK